MATIRPPASPEPAGHAASMIFHSLAERVREGPLRTMLSLHFRAGMYAVDETDDAMRLQKLVELSQLTRLAGAQLEDFTRELQSLIDHMAAANGRVQ